MPSNRPAPNTLDDTAASGAVDMTAGDDVFDFSAVKGPEPVPVGTYHVRVKEAKPATSKNGNPKISAQYQIVSIIEGGSGDPEADGKLANRVVFDDLTFTVNSAFRVKRHLQALGFPKDFKGNVAAIADQMKGREAIAEITIDAGQTNPDDPDETYPDRNRIAKLRTVETPAF